MDPAWVTAALALATAVVAITAWGGRWLWRLGRRTWVFMDDWNGEKPSPGHPGSPGVLERLTSVEEVTQRILREVTLNSGKSMKDVVTRTEGAVGELQTRVDSVARQVENLPGGNP